MANDILKFLEDFFFHVITELPRIEIGTMTLWAGLKLDEEGLFLKYVIHFNFTFGARDIEDLVKSCADEIIADIDRLRALERFQIFLLKMVKEHTKTIGATIDLDTLKVNNFHF